MSIRTQTATGARPEDMGQRGPLGAQRCELYHDDRAREKAEKENDEERAEEHQKRTKTSHRRTA